MNTQGIDFFSEPNWPTQLPEVTVKPECLPQEPKSSQIPPVQSDPKNYQDDIHRTHFADSGTDNKEGGLNICLVKEQEYESQAYIFNQSYQDNVKQQSGPQLKYEYQQLPQNYLEHEMSFSFGEDSNENFSQKKRNPKYKILNKTSKLFLVNQTQYMSISQVAKMYGVSINNLCRWKKSCERKAGAGRKVNDKELEEKLIDWINKQKLKNGGIDLTRRMIQDKARRWSSNSSFKASKGWFQRFVIRNKQLELMELLGIKLNIDKIKKEEMIEFPTQLFICSTKGVRNSERLRVKQQNLKQQEDIYQYIDK